jgi:hypothetical protein
MMASTASATAAAAAVAFGAAVKPRGPAPAAALRARVPAGGRRRSGVVVRCDAGVEAQAQAVAKAASIAALEQFKISADRECFAPSPVCHRVCRRCCCLSCDNLGIVPAWRIVCVASRLLRQLGLVLLWYRSKGVGALGNEKGVGVHFALCCCNFALTRHNLNIHCRDIRCNLETSTA